MTIEERGDLAKSYFLKGYNCTQAVLLAFLDKIPLDEKEALLLASSFGGGMGGMREVCGTVTGIFMVAGLLFGYVDPKAPQEKKEHYSRIRELADAFKKENGSIICGQLLAGVPVPVSENEAQEGEKTVILKKKPCPELVKMATKILDQYMVNNENV